MIPYAVTSGDIPERLLILPSWADSTMASLPNDATCHEACARFMEHWNDGRHRTNILRVYDAKIVWGHYMLIYEHSWIELCQGSVIFDVYPVGGVRPLLLSKAVYVQGIMGGPFRDLYKAKAVDTVSMKESKR